ncbi:hypothetical protein PS704_01469 [Pseudomonas fluorescens]|uniref:Uncharacterized protein n=1 Tax=Pseudomonas fluorescens TaxID=294 RepID=A0A5E7B0S1_PSEFL|nr:hypothetical protein PS704_01469 [Pseudomonas fluorescens]
MTSLKFGASILLTCLAGCATTPPNPDASA